MRGGLPALCVLVLGACTVKVSEMPADDGGTDAAPDGAPPVDSGPPPGCDGGSCTPCVASFCGAWEHACALLADATVMCWGANGHGQLGNGTNDASSTPRVVLASAGNPLTGVSELSCGVEDTTCALLMDGTALCWGANEHGQLGDGTTTNRVYPTPVVDALGMPLAGVRHINAIEAHGCAVLQDGTALCWGDNGSGQLGDGTTVDHVAPAPVLEAAAGLPFTGVDRLLGLASSTCALRDDATFWCWGENAAGQLGDDTIMDRSVPVQVKTASGLLIGVTGVGGAYLHACAMTSGAAAYCWGANGEGQLGNGTLDSVHVAARVLADSSGATFDDVVEIAGQDLSTCARTGDDQVWCWGSNLYGQVGIGNAGLGALVYPRPIGITASAIAAGNTTGYALTPNGLVAWGLNNRGQLGDGTIVDRASPVPVALECP